MILQLRTFSLQFIAHGPLPFLFKSRIFDHHLFGNFLGFTFSSPNIEKYCPFQRVHNIWILPIKAILALRVILSINKKRPKINEIHHQFNFHVLYLCYTAKLALMISLLNKKKGVFFINFYSSTMSITSIANFLQQNKICNSQACSAPRSSSSCDEI